MFNINAVELKKALTTFNFIKSNETIVDYTLLQVKGEPYQPLQLTMSNGQIMVSTQITAKILDTFEFRLKLADLYSIASHVTGILQCEVTDKALTLANERIRHELPVIATTINYPSINVISDKLIPMPLKNLLGLDWISLANSEALAFNDINTVTKRVKIDTDTTFLLNNLQGKFLADLGSCVLTRVDSQLHVQNGNTSAILVGTSSKQVPDISRLFELMPIASFELNADEIKELQSLLFADSLVISIKDNVVKFIASDVNNATWQKTGAGGDAFVKVAAKTIQELKGNAKVEVLNLGHVNAIKVTTTDGVVTIGAGMSR